MSDELIERIEAPRTSAGLVGHGHAETTLRRAWDEARLAHGWLLAGPPGIGKATLAWRFVKFLQSGGGGEGLADNPADIAVRQIEAGAHPDCRLVRRSYGKVAPRRFRSQISVEDVRDLGGFMRQTPAFGGWRTVIVDAADEMNSNAANAMLKLLEEPPPQTVLILIAHVPGRLPPTIRSRCQRLVLRPLADGEVRAVLKDKRPALKGGETEALARLAAGSPGRAIALADAGGLQIHDQLSTLLTGLEKADVVEIQAFADSLAPASAEPAYRAFVDLLLVWLQKTVRAAAAGPRPAAERWFAAYDRVLDLTTKADGLNLDRKAVVLSSFWALEKAAVGAG